MTKPLKLIAVGNSTGVILPRDVLDRLRVEKGDQLYLVETPRGFELSVYDPAFVEQMELAEKVMREDRDTLSLLAK